ncbi:efflux RND transporter periplasmic adaptor subunit [Catalinimonas niigatensis]|uniref:efflux RND transporter periplasmic adaptor subunit n=1 Tax=Catalinimonas niigatensis TaxID=1397264 RepID=UPI00266619A0|nr:efflux RND transporter periplasmic adaptor subunit [Catalinimonas niigatensis]WPP50419.1 efflux RND transporter periplasmic adaptor subunit [Catalinimonas niigatensis]
MKTFPSLSLILFLALLWQACSPAESAKAVPAANEAIPVQVIALQKEEVAQPVVTSGQFSTDDETTLSFKTGGIVKDVLVKEGDRVRKGQLLATLDLTEIKTGVSQAELAHKKAQRDFSRTENLYRDSVATLEQYQNAETALALANEQWNAAKFNLSYSEIRAVANGYVLTKFANAGQMISTGDPVIRVNGASDSKWIFKAGVSDKEWAVIQEGDSASILTDALPGQPLPARVVRKSEGADPLNGAFAIELRVDTDQKMLASGLFGTATIIPAKKVNVWRIPHEALLDGNADQGFVFVTDDRKTAHKIQVTIASIGNDYIHISGGLENVSALISRGSAYLKDESAISIVQ